ncbi:ABC transporter substrate-binding protein [Corynebacterium sp. 335C]
MTTPHRTPRRRLLRGAAALGAALLLAGCSGGETAGAPSPAPSDGEPRKVAALSTDAAEAVLDIAGPERMVAVPESSTTPSYGNHVEAARTVGTVLPPGATPDPEQVLSLDPDLVVVTGRHTGERDAAAQLEQAGVRVLPIDNEWATVGEIAANHRAIGDALGEPERADDIVRELEDGLDAADREHPATGDQPSTLVLMLLSGKTYAVGPDSITSDLLRRAGVPLAVEAAGIGKSQSIDAEMLRRINPERIILVDRTGDGAESFADVLRNPAAAEVPAIADDAVTAIPANLISASSGRFLARGYGEMLDAIR